MSILTDLQDARDKAVAAADILHAIVHGPATGAASLVATEAGNVKTMARLAAEIDDAVQNGVAGPAGPTGAAGAAGATGPAGSNFIGSVVFMSAPVTSSGLIHGIGGLHSRATYPAFWTWINANAAPVADGSWTKRRYSTGDGSTTFRVPDLRGYFPRFADGPNGAAAQLDQTIAYGNTTNGSASVTDFVTTAFMYVGMPIAGAGIPLGATVATIASATAITISANATATGAQVPLTFTGREFWSLQGDAIRNIVGIVDIEALMTLIGGGGPFNAVSAGGDGGYVGAGADPNRLIFDASRVVPVAPENRPLNMAFHPCIVAA